MGMGVGWAAGAGAKTHAFLIVEGLYVANTSYRLNRYVFTH